MRQQSRFFHILSGQFAVSLGDAVESKNRVPPGQLNGTLTELAVHKSPQPQTS